MKLYLGTIQKLYRVWLWAFDVFGFHHGHPTQFDPLECFALLAAGVSPWLPEDNFVVDLWRFPKNNTSSHIGDRNWARKWKSDPLWHPHLLMCSVSFKLSSEGQLSCGIYLEGGGWRPRIESFKTAKTTTKALCFYSLLVRTKSLFTDELPCMRTPQARLSDMAVNTKKLIQTWNSFDFLDSR